MPRASRARRAPAQQQLDLALDGNYLNNINPDEMVRHLAVGDATEHAAAAMIERCVGSALAAQADMHAERIMELEEESGSKLYDAHEELDDLLNEHAYDRIDTDTLIKRLYRLNGALALMHNDSTYGLKAALLKIDMAAAMNTKPKRVTRKAPVKG